MLHTPSFSHQIPKSLRQKLCPIQLVSEEASAESQQAVGAQERLDILTKHAVPKGQD